MRNPTPLPDFVEEFIRRNSDDEMIAAYKFLVLAS